MSRADRVGGEGPWSPKAGYPKLGKVLSGQRVKQVWVPQQQASWGARDGRLRAKGLGQALKARCLQVVNTILETWLLCNP